MNIQKLVHNLFHKSDPSSEYWELLRFVLGFIFFWAFLDKTFGLGIATEPAKAWIAGGSPTYGFLAMGVKDAYLSSVFMSMAGNTLVDVLFMLGLGGVGFSLLTGMGMRIAGYSGALLMFFIYLAQLPLKQNPVFDEHIVYIIVLLAFTRVEVGTVYSLKGWWKKTSIVKKYPFLA